MTKTNTPSDSGAVVREHHYSSGRTYYSVECQDCLVVLNSGHHYSEPDRKYAIYLAARHNGTIHRTSL